MDELQNDTGSTNDMNAFTEALQEDAHPTPISPDERVTSQICMVCKQYIKHGQIVSGIRDTTDADEVVGHYACIVRMLGPEKTLQAILAHQLPAIDPMTLIDGRVPGWENLFGGDVR